MNRNLWLISKSILMLAICLTLIGAITVTAQAKLPIEQIPQQEHQLAGEIDGEIQAGGTISGTVTCLGFISNSTSEVYVALHDELFDVKDSVHIPCGETYVLSTDTYGAYQVSAFLNESNTGGGPDDGEPLTITDPIEISSTTPTHTDINIELYRYVERVSLFEGDEGSDSEYSAISGDGHYVVFYVGEGNNVYIVDRENDTTLQFAASGYSNHYSDPDISANGEFVAVAYGGYSIEYALLIKEWRAEPEELIVVDPPVDDYESINYPSISGDGCRVAFQHIDDIYLYDCDTDQTTLISVAADGGDPNGNSYDPAISDDGQFVAFLSIATDLVTPPAPDSEYFLYVRNIAAETTELIPLPAGISGGEFNSTPSISADGRYIAFEYNYSVVDGKNYEIFVHDRETGVTSMISLIGGEPSTDSEDPCISADGRFVAYVTYYGDEVTGDYFGNIYVNEWQTDTLKMAPIGLDKTPNDYPEHLSMSANGRFIAFDSNAEPLVWDDTNEVKDVFVYANEPGLTVDIIGAGSVDVDPDKSTYNLGEIVTLTPIPDEGFAFDKWTVADPADLVDNDDGTWSITMDDDKSLIANFKIATIYIYLPMILK
jgi:Tol biopolymer transport system component